MSPQVKLKDTATARVKFQDCSGHKMDVTLFGKDITAKVIGSYKDPRLEIVYQSSYRYRTCHLTDLTNWGEPERAPHERYNCARNILL